MGAPAPCIIVLGRVDRRGVETREGDGSLTFEKQTNISANWSYVLGMRDGEVEIFAFHLNKNISTCNGFSIKYRLLMSNKIILTECILFRLPVVSLSTPMFYLVVEQNQID